jgi:hypothetical protein
MTALAILLLMFGGLLIWAGITNQSVIAELTRVFKGSGGTTAAKKHG